MSYIMNENTNEGLTEEIQERILKLNTLARMYELTNRVLTGDPVVVHIAPDGPAPAWSDGQSITFNADEIEHTDIETLTQITGLNYHELSHHLYTPRRNTDLTKWVIDQNYFQSFNMLEDQRIETLLTGRYPAVVPFLQATILRWLANTPQDLETNYMLVRGRRYLPVKIRERFRSEFKFPELIPVIIDIVDQYRALAFPRDYQAAMPLIERFQKEVLDVISSNTNLPQGPGGCTGRAPTTKGRPEPGKAQERDADRGSGIGKEESEFDPEAQSGSAGGAGDKDEDANSESSEGKGNKDGEEDKDGRDGKGTSDDVAPLQKQNPGDAGRDSSGIDVHGTDKKEVGNGHTASAHQKDRIPDDLADLINESIEDVLARKDVQTDIRTKQRVLNGGDGKHSEIIRVGKYNDNDVDAAFVKSARRFAQELQRLRDESEPAWMREMPSGRVNVQRVIRGCELDQAFDRWDEGNDSTDIEAVILIDRSGSMRSDGNDAIASVSCWAIKRAMEQIEAPVTVYAFDDRTEVAYKRDEKTSKTRYKFIHGNGGTDPYDSLIAAERLFKSTRKSNKILFIISDGVFSVDKNDEVIERMGKSGVLTALALIASDQDVANYKRMAEQYRQSYPDNPAYAQMYELEHKTEIFTNIRSAADLIPFARSVVTGAIKKRSGRF
jgi:hypothetical protein